MTNTSNTPTPRSPRSVRDELRNAYKQASDFEGSLYSALFAALMMLERQEARIDALESKVAALAAFNEKWAESDGQGAKTGRGQPVAGAVNTEWQPPARAWEPEETA